MLAVCRPKLDIYVLYYANQSRNIRICMQRKLFLKIRRYILRFKVKKIAYLASVACFLFLWYSLVD